MTKEEKINKLLTEIQMIMPTWYRLNKDCVPSLKKGGVILGDKEFCDNLGIDVEDGFDG